MGEGESHKRCVRVMAEEMVFHDDQIIMSECLKEFWSGEVPRIHTLSLKTPTNETLSRLD